MTREQWLVRDLAARVRDLSQTPEKREIAARYRDINALHPRRPPILAHLPLQAINELFRPGDLETTDPFLRGLERGFRMKLMRGEAVGDDMPVTDVVYTGFNYRVSDWMDGYHTVRLGEDLHAARFEPCIVEDTDFEKLRIPELSIDQASTEENFNRVRDILGDLLMVVKGVPFSSVCGWGESMVDQLVEMRGLEAFYFDLLDRPERVHQAMEFMTRGHLLLLKRFREEGLLTPNAGENVIGSSSPGLSSELPESGRGEAGDCERNLWGFAQAQELSGVSAAMLEEFVLPYQARILNRFGLCAYGCCEAIERKIDSVARHVKNLRMLSISPFADAAAAAEKCRGRYVMAWKPQPSYLVDFNEKAIEEEMRRTLESARGCCITINLMDVFEYGGRPERFRMWTQIARRAVDRWYRET